MSEQEQAKDRLVRAEKAVLGEIWSSGEAYANLRYLCDYVGDRWAGSESERAAAAFLIEKARDYGLRDVQAQEFRHVGWQRGETKLEVLSPVRREVAAIALPYTPSGDLEGDVIWVGQGEEEDFRRLEGQVAGKIAMSAAESTPGPGQYASHRREKFARALDAGAIAFLFVNQNPGMLAITGALAAGFEGELPALGLPKESGDYIQRLLEAGPVRLRLRVASTFVPTSSANVCARVGPTNHDGPFLLTGGHYDAHDVAVGALDNAAGAVVCLEAARALAQVSDLLPMEIRLVLFACEEVGLLGAWHYVEQQRAELARARFVLNVDAAARGVPGNENLTLCGFPELVPYFDDVVRAMNYVIPVRDRISAYSDHFPFAVSGIPSATLGARDADSGLIGRGWGHTAADTVDKVNPKSLQASAATVARLLLRVAYEEQWPSRHRSAEEVAQTIDASPIGWYVRRFGQYPFQPRPTIVPPNGGVL